jgi:hypothetical protein
MLVSLNSGSVIAILPERTLLAFALVVFLRHPSGDKLHALSNHVLACVLNK